MSKIKQVRRNMKAMGVTTYVILERHIYSYQVQCEKTRERMKDIRDIYSIL